MEKSVSDKVAQAEAANELFEELLNGEEPGEAHRETPAGALLFSRVSKRLVGTVYWPAWEHFSRLSVAELHDEYTEMQDMSKGQVQARLREYAKSG